MASTVPTTRLPSGEKVPVLGLGTWAFADKPARRGEEIAALRLGLDLGMTLIDTAELYGGGASEELVGEAIARRRDEVFLVTKITPANASRQGTIAAAERSLKHLKTDRIDLYLLHWIGPIHFEETVSAFESLVKTGKIRYWGVSNFDQADMEELLCVPGGESVATNQVLYNLTRRGIEWDLTKWSAARHIPIIAYSPVEQGRLLTRPELREIAARHNATPAQVALAWLLGKENVIVIPKAASLAHVRENRAALDLRLTPQDLADLDRAFPPPVGSRPLEML